MNYTIYLQKNTVLNTNEPNNQPSGKPCQKHLQACNYSTKSPIRGEKQAMRKIKTNDNLDEKLK